jgi:hypothetical protein
MADAGQAEETARVYARRTPCRAWHQTEMHPLTRGHQTVLIFVSLYTMSIFCPTALRLLEDNSSAEQTFKQSVTA